VKNFFQSNHWQVNSPGTVAGRYLISRWSQRTNGKACFKERKRRLGGALAEAPASVENSHIAHFEFGMVKTAIFGTSLKLMAILLASVRFEAVKGDFKSILSEYASCLVWM